MIKQANVIPNISKAHITSVFRFFSTTEFNSIKILTNVVITPKLDFRNFCTNADELRKIHNNEAEDSFF